MKEGLLRDVRLRIRASERAARAARAANVAARAAEQPIFEAGFACLDGLLEIGKQADPFTQDTKQAVKAYRDLVAA